MDLDFEVYDAGNGDLIDIFSILVTYDPLIDMWVPDETDWAVVLTEWGGREVVLQVQDRSKNVQGFSSSGTMRFPLVNQ